MKEQEDYYQVGSAEDIVVSNSSLSSFDIETGGSPARFLEFLDNKEEIKSKPFITGGLLHQWHEDPNAFHIASVAKPSERLGEVADIILLSINKRIEEAKVLIEGLDNEFEKQSRETQLQEFLSLFLEEESTSLSAEILLGCRTLGWNPKWGDEAISKNADPKIMPYIQDSLRAEGENKVYMTEANSILLTGMIESIKKKEVVYQSLFDNSADFDDKIEVITEFEHYWTVEVPYENIKDKKSERFPIKCKLRSDKVVLDYAKKVCRIKDLKSSNGSPYSFVNSFVKYNYARQFAFYAIGLKDYLTNMTKIKPEELKDWTFEYENVVIEKGGLFECACIEVTQEVVDLYTKVVKDLLRNLAWHSGNRIWDMTKEEYLNGGFITITLEQVEKNKANN